MPPKSIADRQRSGWAGAILTPGRKVTELQRAQAERIMAEFALRRVLDDLNRHAAVLTEAERRAVVAAVSPVQTASAQG